MSGSLSNIEIWLQEISEYSTEIVFIVDNSTDKTFINLKAIVDCNNYKNIKIVNGNFGGPGNARNFGIAQTSGKWVAFWDSDDNPNVEAFLTMVNNAHKLGKKIAIGGWKKNISNQDKTPMRFRNMRKFNSPNFFKTVRNPGIWRWAFKKPIIDGIFFPNLLMGEDQVFLANLNINWWKVYKNRKNVYNYIEGNSSQLTANPAAIEERLEMGRYLVKTPVNGKHFSFFTRTLRLKIKLSVLINRLKS
jgi:glycosyltransferase involved in cell wall biosynthesis